MKRRNFLQRAGWGLLLCSPWKSVSAQTKRVSPASAFDAAMREYMDALAIPGGALAVLKAGRLVYAQGYGWADRQHKIPATPDSLFRIASLSKPITALAILKLIQQGRLRLTDRVFEVLALARFAPRDESFDERWREITIEQLLHHTGGWDRDQSFDPMFRPRLIARQFDVPSPAGAWDVIRYMLGQPLDFAPGQRYAYSNFGYCLLGRVIEEVTEEAYEAHVRGAVLDAAGCVSMRLGRSLADDRAKDEVRYYTPGDETVDSVFDAHPGPVPRPYGGFHLEAMDAHGGWLASVRDLARLTAALDAPGAEPLLSADSLRTLRHPPSPPVSRDGEGRLADSYYGGGWMVRPKGENGRANYWHNGSLPGTTALWVRRHDGVSYAALFNLRNRNGRGRDMNIDPMLYRAADRADWE